MAHAASVSANAVAAAAPRRQRAMLLVFCLPVTFTAARLASNTVHDFELRGMQRLNSRSPALLDPATHPHASPLELLRLDSAVDERALVALLHGDGKVF